MLSSRQPNFSEHAKPLTDLTSHCIPECVVLNSKSREAFFTLKTLLCQATVEPLRIIDVSQPFSLYVDSFDFSIGAALTQTVVKEDGDSLVDYPVAFASAKLTTTHFNGGQLLRKKRMLLCGACKSSSIGF